MSDDDIRRMMEQPPDPRGREQQRGPFRNWTLGELARVTVKDDGAEPEAESAEPESTEQSEPEFAEPEVVHASASAPIGLRPQRRPKRFFTDEQKLSMLAEYDRAPFGTKGNVLKKYGLNPGNLSEWAKKRDKGLLAVTSYRPGAASTIAQPADQPGEMTRLAELAARRDELRRQKEQVDAELAAVSAELLEFIVVMAEVLADESEAS